MVNFITFIASHKDSTFDLAISGFLTPHKINHSTGLLGEVCRILKPRGSLYIQEIATETSDDTSLQSKDKLASLLKLSGFVEVSKVKCLMLLCLPCFFLAAFYRLQT